MSLEIDIRQSRKYAKFMKSCGWKIIPYLNPPTKKKQYMYIWEVKVLNSAIVRLHRVNHPIPFSRVEKTLKRYSFAHVRIEPNILTGRKSKKTEELFAKYHYRVSDWSHFPTVTLTINLSLSEKNLLGNMKPKTRYNIRLAERKGTIVKFFEGSALKPDSTALKSFYKILKETEKRKVLPIYPFEWLIKIFDSFGRNSTLALGYYEKEPVAGTLFLNDNKILFYCLNGSTKLGRKFHVPTYLIWEAMRYAKSLGVHYLDFDGVYDERLSESTSTWLGFTKFKNSFGGKAKKYLLPYEKVHTRNHKIVSDAPLRILTPEFLPSLYPEPWLQKTKLEKILSKLVFA